MISINSVDPEDCQMIGDFSERVIMESVAAPVEQKVEFVANVRKNIELWQLAPESGLHLQAVDHELLAGVILVRDYWNLCNLFVAPELHRRGIGRALINVAIEMCRSRSPRGCMRLNASPNAIGFYRTMGFQAVPDAPPQYRGIPFQLDF